MYVNYNRFTIAASCTHVSAVLHALNGLKQLTLQPQLLDMPVEEADNNEIILPHCCANGMSLRVQKSSQMLPKRLGTHEY